MQKTIRSRLLGLACALLALFAAISVFLLPPVRESTLPGTDVSALACDGGGSFSLVILADDPVPLNRLDPLVRMARQSGGSSYILRRSQTGSSLPDTLSQFSGANREPLLLFTYGAGWEEALAFLDSSDAADSTVILSPSGSYDPAGITVRTPLMLLGTSSDQAPTSQRLAELYNTLSGEHIAPNGLSFTSQSGNFRLRVVSASLDAYQTFSDDTLSAIADWYRESAGVTMEVLPSYSLIRLAGWALGTGGLLLLLLMLDHLLSEELLDVGYSLLPLNVTSSGRYGAFRALACLPALALLAVPALVLVLLPLPGLTPIPGLFCGYFGCLGLLTLVLLRLRNLPGVSGTLSFPVPSLTTRRLFTAVGSLAAVLIVAVLLESSGLYTLRLSAEKLPAFLLCALAAGIGTAGWLCDSMLLDQCKFSRPVRLLLELLPFLPYAGLAFLAIPAFGFTGFYTVLMLAGALAAALLLARLLRLILGQIWIPAVLSGLLMGVFSAFSVL